MSYPHHKGQNKQERCHYRYNPQSFYIIDKRGGDHYYAYAPSLGFIQKAEQRRVQTAQATFTLSLWLPFPLFLIT